MSLKSIVRRSVPPQNTGGLAVCFKVDRVILWIYHANYVFITKRVI